MGPSVVMTQAELDVVVELKLEFLSQNHTATSIYTEKKTVHKCDKTPVPQGRV
jgi:hypothetical protein